MPRRSATACSIPSRERARPQTPRSALAGPGPFLAATPVFSVAPAYRIYPGRTLMRPRTAGSRPRGAGVINLHGVPFRCWSCRQGRRMRNAGAMLVLALVVTAGPATEDKRVESQDILPSIHFAETLRASRELDVHQAHELDVRPRSTWSSATQALKRNEEIIYDHAPHSLGSTGRCPFPVVGSTLEMVAEFWAFGDSIKVTAVDTGLRSGRGRTQVGRVKTSFWNWGSHWVRTQREWRDQSGNLYATSTGGAQSWYHNTVAVDDCQGRRLAYLKFKLGEGRRYTRITVHDLVGNEVATAATPLAGVGFDRHIVLHDRNSGTKLVEIDELSHSGDWRIAFQEGSQVLGGLGSDSRVVVMLVASMDSANQFGLASLPVWALLFPAFLLALVCVWVFLGRYMQSYMGYKPFYDGGGRHAGVMEEAQGTLWNWVAPAPTKLKVDAPHALHEDWS